MGRLTIRKLKRLLYSLLGGFAVPLIALFITGIGLIFQIVRTSSVSASPFALTWLVESIGAGLLFGLLSLIFQVNLEYTRRTHDPTWILKFQDKFDGDDLKEKRRLAAKTLLERKQDLTRIDDLEEQLSPIDDVLDFFEDIGFYVSGDQISPEVAHHHFYHWIRGYWYASRAYVETWQREESARWNHLLKLLQELDEIENESVPPTAEELERFLKEESAC
jgi:hypothetical protein